MATSSGCGQRVKGPLQAISLFPLLAVYFGLALTAPSQETPAAQTHAEGGLQLAQAGDLASAEAELRRAVELAPNDPAYLAGLGTVLAMEKKLEESTPFLKKALELGPPDRDVRRNLAANLWQLGRLQEAKQNLQMILRATPEDTGAVLLLRMVSENLKQYATAAKLLGSVPTLGRQRPESIAALARSYYRTGQPVKAREKVQDLLDRSGDSKAVFLCARRAVRQFYPQLSCLRKKSRRIRYVQTKAESIGFITLDVKCVGARSAVARHG